MTRCLDIVTGILASDPNPLLHLELSLTVLHEKMLRAPDFITLSSRHPLFLPHWSSLPQTHMTVLPQIGESALLASASPLIPYTVLGLGPLPAPYQTVSSASSIPHSIIIKRPRKYMEGPLPRGYGRESLGM